MAINPGTQYPGQTAAPTAGYPLGSAQNVTVSGDGTGTPLERNWLNDLWGFFQAMLDSVGITASGTPDQVGASQYLDALNTRLGTQFTLEVISNLLTEGLYNGKSLSFNAQTTTGKHVAFSDDGRNAYVSDFSGQTIYQYTVTVPFDLSTATYSGNSFSAATQLGANAIEGIWLRADGTLLYALSGSGAQTIYRYTLSTAFDVSTASFVNSFTFLAPVENTSDLWVAPDGLRLVLLDDGTTSNAIYTYNFGTAWDVTTLVRDVPKSLSVGAQDTVPTGLAVSPDGLYYYVSGNQNDNVYQYLLSTAFDISTGVLNHTFTGHTANDPVANGMAINAEATRFYVVGASNDRVFQYHMSKVVA